jgi:tetratricopeptide (TPR) repeat protein
MAAVLKILAQIEDDLGQLDQAIEHARRALAIQENLTPNGERLPDLLGNMGDVLTSAGRFNEAHQYYARAVALREKLLGTESTMLHFPLSGLGRTLLRMDRAREALPILRRALALKEKAFGANNPLLTDVLSSLAEANLRLGRSDDARRMLERGAELVRTNVHTAADQAEIDFGFACLLWSDDRSSALARAIAARDGFAAAHDRRRLADVTSWMTKHASGSDSLRRDPVSPGGR